MNKKHKTIVIDFDGVIAEYEGWKDGAIGEPVEGVVKALEHLRALGFRLVIQTCRTHPLWGASNSLTNLLKLVVWLRTNKIPYDEIDLYGKAIGDYYIDDRAIRFRNWDQALRDLKALETGKYLKLSYLRDLEEER